MFVHFIKCSSESPRGISSIGGQCSESKIQLCGCGGAYQSPLPWCPGPLMGRVLDCFLDRWEMTNSSKVKQLYFQNVASCGSAWAPCRWSVLHGQREDGYTMLFLTLFVDRPIWKYKKKMHLPSRSVGDGQLLKLLGWSSTFWVAAKRVSGQAGRHTVIIY